MNVIYEDDYIIAINKLPRIASVAAENIPHSQTALGMLEKQFADKKIKPYILHRLDRETSGVLLFGKFRRDRGELEKIFQNPSTEKKYVALLKGIPKGSVISKPLQARTGGFIPAQTHFRILKTFRVPPLAFVEATIKTGRKHQIRKHFSSIGQPVVMDAVYGDRQFNRKFRLTFRLGRLFLHAEKITFLHPHSKKIITIEAPFPPDLQNVLKKLGLQQ